MYAISLGSQYAWHILYEWVLKWRYACKVSAARHLDYGEQVGVVTYSAPRIFIRLPEVKETTTGSTHFLEAQRRYTKLRLHSFTVWWPTLATSSNHPSLRSGMWLPCNSGDNLV